MEKDKKVMSIHSRIMGRSLVKRPPPFKRPISLQMFTEMVEATHSLNTATDPRPDEFLHRHARERRREMQKAKSAKVNKKFAGVKKE